MNKIIENLSYYMYKGSIEVEIFDDDTNIREITEDELNTVIHPSASFTVITDFDIRASADYSKKPDVRSHTFNKTATVRDLVKWISEGPCYGYFEGLQKIKNGLYVVAWGT